MDAKIICGYFFSIRFWKFHKFWDYLSPLNIKNNKLTVIVDSWRNPVNMQFFDMCVWLFAPLQGFQTPKTGDLLLATWLLIEYFHNNNVVYSFRCPFVHKKGQTPFLLKISTAYLSTCVAVSEFGCPVHEAPGGGGRVFPAAGGRPGWTKACHCGSSRDRLCCLSQSVGRHVSHGHVQCDLVAFASTQ
jgi:hypothetical protein